MSYDAMKIYEEEPVRRSAPSGMGDTINETKDINSDSEIIPKKTNNRLIKASCIADDISPPKWTIKGILPEDGLIEFFGASGSFKSFLVLDMCFCIALHKDWQGISVEGGTVIYVAGEGKGGLGRRLKGLENHYGQRIENFFILPMPSNLADRDEMELLACEIKECCSEKIKMIIFDTLHRNSAGSDENSASAFSIILNNIDTFIKPLCLGLVGWVHHTGVDGTRGRGTTSRYAALDAQIKIEKKGNLKCLMSCEKQKDADFFEPIGFEMCSVDVGLVDEENNPITTLVPSFSGEIVSNNKTQVKALSPKEQESLNALTTLLKEKNTEPVTEEIKEKYNLSSEDKMVSVYIWRDEVFKIIESNGDDDPKKEKNAKRMRFKRIKEKLIELNYIIEYDDNVILSDQGVLLW